MARAYSVRTTALALGVPPKWVDNVLSHYDIPGVASQRQGIEREVGDLGVLVLELIRVLNYELGIPIPRAVIIAIGIAADANARFVSPSGAEIRFSRTAIEVRLREQLIDAIEATPRMRRGRPPKSR